MPPVEMFVAALFVKLTLLPALAISTSVREFKAFVSATAPAELLTSRDVAVIAPCCVRPAVLRMTVLP